MQEAANAQAKRRQASDDAARRTVRAIANVPQKRRPKLKTPETEASGVSILITHSTTGCCVLQSPQELTTSFHWLSLPLALSAQNLRLSPTVLHSNSTGGQLLRLGSVFRHPAR
jgi:hypothetical protein